jgi:hypothetical protein
MNMSDKSLFSLSRLTKAMALALLLGLGLLPQLTYAQMGGGQGGGRGQGGGAPRGDEDGPKKADEWEQKDLQLEKSRADGPCPYVKVLYDAARYHEFQGGKESLAEVKYTGEINGVASDCAYRGDEPITVEMVIGFSLGKGPKAALDNHTYRYWVAVTRRDTAVLEKAYFDLPVKFAASENVKVVAAKLENIVIPRKDAKVSGSNFEILVGFDVTPSMAAFNAEGKRFRMGSK